MAMAVETRPELVGKRFLCVSGDEPLDLGDIGRWGWRAGVIRAVTHRDNNNSELTVYVEFDDLEWEKREWVKVYEDFQVFLLEQQLVWAKRRESSLLEQQLVRAKRRESTVLGENPQGTKDRHIQWPALTFRPLVGKATLGSITAVEFFSDRQLDFLSDHGAYQPYQDEVDSLSPVLRDNPELHEEVRFWLKDQQVQEIFLQGPYSLNGYRVRVYRQDSATQWFTGIITYHDLFSRNMVVMNDQVLEPQNVDPSMIQMTFLDDVVHSLLKGENIGIQSRRRSRSSNNQNNSAHGHYTRAQANSPRPVMNSSGGAVKQGSGVTTQQQQGQGQSQQAPAQHSPCQEQMQQHRGPRVSRRKGSDSSVPDDDMKGDHVDCNERAGRGGEDDEEYYHGEDTTRDFFKSTSSKPVAVNKRRKAEEEEEKKSGLKRLRSETTVRSDFSESSDSEMSTKRTRTADSSSSSEQNSEEELKGKTGQEGHKSQSPKTGKESALTGSLSPWGEELQKVAFQQSSADREPRSSLRQQQAPHLSSSQGSAPSEGQGECIMENNSAMKDPSQTNLQSKDQYTSAGVVARTQTPSQYIIHITAEDANAHMASRENSEAVSALLASQNPSEPSYLSEPSRHLVLNPSVAPPSPLRKSPSECDLRNQTPSVSECDLRNQPPSVTECDLRNQTPSVTECDLRNQTPSVSECDLRNQTPSVSECDLRNQTPSVSECNLRNQTPSVSECNLRNQTPSVSECNLRNQTPSVSECNLRNQTPSVSECNLRNQTPSVSECDLRNQTPSVSECDLRNQTPSVTECRKPEAKQHVAGSLGSKMELVHSVVIRPVASVSESAAVVEREKQLYSSMLPCIKNASLADEARKSYKLNPSPDVPKPLPSPEALKHKPLCLPDIVKSKTQSVLETGSKPKPLTSPEVSKHKVRYPDNPPRSSFKPVLARGTESPGSCTKSPLIIDKNEHFTVYRDPALVRPNQESNHVSYLHPQLHPLHASSHASSHHHTSHLLPSSHHHLLSGVLSGLPPGPLLGGHPRLDSSGLGHLGLAHHHPVSQPQTHSHTSASYNQLGLYPIIWQYPNGTRSYPPGLNLPGSKWVHPENTVNSESSTRRNTASPWIHHQVPVSSSDSLNLLSHVPVPVRPASADPHRSDPQSHCHDPHRLIKINPHASPPLPLAKTTGDLHKEDLKGFVDPIRTITLAHLKQEQDCSRTPTGKDSHLHHLYLEAHNKQQQQRMVQQQEAGQMDRASKYKEENRRILQESIEVAPFTAKIRFSETDREPNPYPRIPSLPHPYPRIPSLPSLPHRLHQEKETERPAVDLYQFKQQAASQHSLPPSNYFTTLSNSVVNEPPRLYPSKELNSYFEKVSTAQDSAAASSLSLGGGSAFSSKSLSKPPPLIKHQADGEGLLGKKISEQLRYRLSTIVSPVSPDLSPSSSQTQSQTQTQSLCQTQSWTQSLCQTQSQSHCQTQSPCRTQSQTLAQLRSMPALHRAPVFHPPIQHTLDRKEAGYGRLSPPTLTPIQPVSSAGKVSERQKPPTLLPELREVSAVCKGGAAMTSSEVWRAGDSQSHDKLGWHSERSPGRKPGATTASVIVRPSTCIKYDGSPGAKTSSSAKDSLTGRMFPGSRPQTVCLKLAYERDRESGGNVILPNTNLEEAVCVQQYNNNFMRVSQSQGTFPVSVSAAANSVCNRTSDVTRAVSNMAPYGVLSRRQERTYCGPNTSSANRTEICGPRGRTLHSGPGLGPRAELQQQQGGSSRTSSPNLHPGSSPSLASSTQASPNPGSSPILASSTQASPNPSQSYYGSFIHLKKHKAALAAAQQSRGPSSSSRSPEALAAAAAQQSRGPSNSSRSPEALAAAAQQSRGPSNSSSGSGLESLIEPSNSKALHISPPPPLASASAQDHRTTASPGPHQAGASPSPCPLPNGQPAQMNQSQSQPNCHKLKKAWLTRHSEEDRNINTMIKTEEADKSVTTSVSPSVSKAVTTSVSPSVSKTVTTSVSKAVTTTVSPSVSKSVTTSVSPSVSKSVTTAVSPSVSKAVTTTVSKAVTTAVSPSVSKAVTTAVSPSVSKGVTTAVSPSVSKAVTTTVSPSVSKAVTTTVSPSVSKAVTTSVSPSVSKAVTTSVSPSVSEMEMIKPCTVTLIASTSSDVEMKIEEVKGQEDKMAAEDRNTRRGSKRVYDHDSASESGEDSDASESSKQEQRAKRQPKPTYKKKQNDMQRRKGEGERDEEELKPNGIFRSAREKTKLKQSSNNGIPRSVLKDWRKVKKLKQTGESFLQDDSCSEIGPNLQKCRECRVVRSKKGEQPAHSPVFCRFYYFRRLSYSKNGVIRVDGFSTPDQFDEEALSLWAPDVYEENELDPDSSKYILSYIGDQFCQMVTTENTAASWIKKDAKMAWKRAVRGVREMCDACEATLFNIHWVCHKCGFVVCLDCYKAKERKSSKDKELYAWLKCVKGQQHGHKYLMPTQIIPGTVLAEVVSAMHLFREKDSVRAPCVCTGKHTSLLNKLPVTNGVSQVLQNVLNHSNKVSLCNVKTEPGQLNPIQGKAETNGGSSPASDISSDSKRTPPESQSPLHFLADLAEQKSREEKKENKESPLGKVGKEDKVSSLESLHCKASSLESLHCKASSLVSNITEQGSTLRDLLTTTAGKLRLGSTDAGIAFAPVYSTAAQMGKSGRSMPNILDDIIASVVENKIPASRGAKLSLKLEATTTTTEDREVKTERNERNKQPGTGPNPGTGTGPNPGTGTGPNPGAGTGPNPGAGTGPNPGAGTGPNPGAGTGPNPGAGTGPNPGAGTGPNPGAGTGPNPGAGTGPNPGAGTGQLPVAKPQLEKTLLLHADIPHCWLYERRLLWLKDHRHPGNWKLFRECWRQGQPVLVTGLHKPLNAALWKADSFNQEFADHQGDLLNCKDGLVSNAGINEFWDGFEDLTKRPKSKDGDTVVYRLKDWPSGEEFMALMPSRYDDLMRNLPLPEYCDPEGNLNLASHLPSFFVRPDLGPRLCCAYGVAASQEQDFGTANLHMEVSDIVSVLVYVGVAKGNGVLSKTGVLKRLEEEDLDDSVKKRLKDSSETPGALWHIYISRDVEKIKEFLHKVAKEQGAEISAEHDPIREPGWYLSRKLRQRLWEEHDVQGLTVVQFLGDSVLIPAGALHQVQNLHSCVQVINDFVSPEHVFHSFHLTQELRSSREEPNYEDKLQVKNILFHSVKDALTSLKRYSQEEEENS
ncbi:probable JmjC domain-containing histone demethylation protein 2C isoform X9 [Salmo salar]|uniref:Probable JmjC domain-containing histone demethylation protein 2C isoform X9 n=1 Tax=Salmo salar TaxID=8030 RepID=A0ABM3C9Y4_SALSA|nr:probable JmjC domain-containing histone demethylation protein 2C isoform X9 [Salmo salar]